MFPPPPQKKVKPKENSLCKGNMQEDSIQFFASKI